MARIPVKSSEIAAVGYDAEKQVLEVEFLRGSIHVFQGVPDFVYQALLSAESPGSYYHAHVRRAGYPHRKLA